MSGRDANASDRGAAASEIDDDDDDSDYEQQMDERAAHVQDEKSQGPQNENDDCDRQKHGGFLLLLIGRRNG
jgi:hypothetical protein